MSTTITLPTVELKSVTRTLASDWGPMLHRTARRIAAVLVAVYTVWVMAEERWQQLVAWAMRHQVQGLARLGLPGGNVKAFLTGSATEESSAVAPDHVPAAREMVLQRLAPARPAGPSVGMAPPSIQRLAAEGFSQRQISSTLGITRYQVRKALSRA